MVFTMATALMISATGCKHRPVDTTDIPGRTRVGVQGEVGDSNMKPPGGAEITGPVIPVEPKTELTKFDNPPVDPSTGNIPAAGSGTLIDKLINGPHNEDVSFFAQDTIYFDTDKSIIKTEEASKLEHVAAYYHDHPQHGLIVKGYCDERGTEGYNIALGDRRANAIREYLVTLGVQSGSIKTVSLGEADPVDLGHNEAAWKKNRRGVFVLITPK